MYKVFWSLALRGKGWEIRSLAWCQRRVVPDRCNSQTCIDQPLVYQTTSCIDTVFRTLQSQVFGQDITRRTLRFFIRCCPPHIYPHVYLTSCTWLYFPGFPPPFLHTASDQKLDAGNGLGTRLTFTHFMCGRDGNGGMILGIVDRLITPLRGSCTLVEMLWLHAMTDCTGFSSLFAFNLIYYA